MNNTATIHTRAWAGDEALTLTFPDGWTVETFGPEECPQVTADQIQTAFDNPIGTPRIAELAKGKNSAAIIVDDLSRPTPAAELIPYVLKELDDRRHTQKSNPLCRRWRLSPPNRRGRNRQKSGALILPAHIKSRITIS